MLRYVLYIAVVFLVADHVYTHWGPQIINWIVNNLTGEEAKVVKQPPHRESLIDRLIEELKDKLKEVGR